MGRTLAAWEAAARTHNRSGHQSRHACSNVNNCAAGKVDGADLTKGTDVSTAPNHLAHGAVDEQAPKQGEPEPGLEVDPLHKGAGNKRRGDDREHALEKGEGGSGDGETISEWSITELTAYAVEPHLAETTDEGAAEAGVEGEGVADHNPDDTDEPHQEKAHHHGVEHVLGAGEAAVEERQAWGHKQNQG